MHGFFMYAPVDVRPSSTDSMSIALGDLVDIYHVVEFHDSYHVRYLTFDSYMELEDGSFGPRVSDIGVRVLSKPIDLNQRFTSDWVKLMATEVVHRRNPVPYGLIKKAVQQRLFGLTALLSKFKKGSPEAEMVKNLINMQHIERNV